MRDPLSNCLSAADFLPLPNLGTNQFSYNGSLPYTDDRWLAAERKRAVPNVIMQVGLKFLF